MTRILLLLLLIAGFTIPKKCHAEEYPLFHPARLSAALGVNHLWYEGGDGLSRPVKEFEAGPYVAYNLLSAKPDIEGHSKPILSLTGSTTLGFDSRLLRTQIGLRLILYVGGQ